MNVSKYFSHRKPSHPHLSSLIVIPTRPPTIFMQYFWKPWMGRCSLMLPSWIASKWYQSFLRRMHSCNLYMFSRSCWFLTIKCNWSLDKNQKKKKKKETNWSLDAFSADLIINQRKKKTKERKKGKKPTDHQAMLGVGSPDAFLPDLTHRNRSQLISRQYEVLQQK